MAGRNGDPLAAAHAGERWVVRFQLPDGSATDVVGWIEALNPTSVRLVTAVATVTVIERSVIIAARRGPAAAGGPHPRRISAEHVQRHALHGWLAWREPLGEWTLRSSRRLHSARQLMPRGRRPWHVDPAGRRADHRFRGHP